jgi:dihydrolipoamide dehydrogenase
VDIKKAYANSIVNKTITLKDMDYKIEADKIIISTGAKHKEHPTIKIDKKNIISSREVLTLDSIPKSILIIGGGAIGCEFATFFNSFGSDVDIAEFMPNIVGAEDEDISKALKREMEKNKITIYLKADVEIVDSDSTYIETIIKTANKRVEKKYEKILISIGRSPNSDFLQNNDISLDRGFVKVNDDFSTISNPNIYAIGDVINTPALAHIARYEAKVVANSILKKTLLPKIRVFPSVTFSSPEVASVGAKERELKNQNIEFGIKKHFFKSSSKAKIKGDDSGFIKILYDKSSYQILGASIIGASATELIHELLITIESKITTKELANTIFAHPTLSESILELIEQID